MMAVVVMLTAVHFTQAQRFAQKVLVPGFLCATSVSSVSLWCRFTRNSSTTETQRLHREDRDREFLCKAHAQDKKPVDSSEVRLAQLVEANIIAVHAFQVLLAKQSGKGGTCFGPEGLSENDLNALSEHQAQLLKFDIKQLRLWVQGRQSTFNAAQDLEPILTSGPKMAKEWLKYLAGARGDKAEGTR